MKVLYAHTITNAESRGELALCVSYDDYFVSRIATSGSSYPRSERFRSLPDAQKEFDRIVETQNWMGYSA